MIYAFVRRFTGKSLSFGIAKQDEEFANAKCLGAGVVQLADGYPNNSYELLDFQGSAIDAIITERMRAALQAMDPEERCHSVRPAVLVTRPEIDEPIFRMNFRPRLVEPDVVDLAKTQLSTSARGRISSIYSMAFTEEFEQAAMDPGHPPIFAVRHLDHHLLVFFTEPAARTLDDSGASGFKLFGSDVFFTGIDAWDPYLRADEAHFEELYGPQSTWDRRPETILDHVGHPNDRPEWSPTRYKGEWPPAR